MTRGALALGVAFAGTVPTPPHVPPMVVSNEADEEQLALARRQGAAYVAQVRWEREGAAWSGEAHAGDLRLVATLSPAEGWWTASGWHEPPAGAAHLRVFAEDAGSGRFVPGLAMRATWLAEDGQPLGEAALPAALYPVTDAYGANVTLPPGAARLRVDVDPLRIMRHDPYNGDRFSTATVAVLPLGAVGPLDGPTASDRAEASPPGALVTESRAALEATIHAMWAQASSGGEAPAGELLVDYAVEYAESFWTFSPRGHFRYTLENERSARENAHVEVAPRDPRTGRLLPAAEVTVAVSGAGTHELSLLWHPWLYHFGRNWRVPHAGEYRLDVTVVPDDLPHYGRATGNALFAPVEVRFDHATIRTGSK